MPNISKEIINSTSDTKTLINYISHKNVQNEVCPNDRSFLISLPCEYYLRTTSSNFRHEVASFETVQKIVVSFPESGRRMLNRFCMTNSTERLSIHLLEHRATRIICVANDVFLTWPTKSRFMMIDHIPL